MRQPPTPALSTRSARPTTAQKPRPRPLRTHHFQQSGSGWRGTGVQRVRGESCKVPPITLWPSETRRQHAEIPPKAPLGPANTTPNQPPPYSPYQRTSQPLPTQPHHQPRPSPHTCAPHSPALPSSLPMPPSLPPSLIPRPPPSLQQLHLSNSTPLTPPRPHTPPPNFPLFPPLLSTSPPYTSHTTPTNLEGQCVTRILQGRFEGGVWVLVQLVQRWRRLALLSVSRVALTGCIFVAQALIRLALHLLPGWS
jgi:hypothetical protein